MIETEGYIKSKRLTYWERNPNVYCINKNKDLIPCDIFIKQQDKFIDDNYEFSYLNVFCNNTRRLYGLPTLRKRAYFKIHKTRKITDGYDKRKRHRKSIQENI